MKITLDIRRTDDGRVEGTVASDEAVRMCVSGWLELLRALECLTSASEGWRTA